MPLQFHLVTPSFNYQELAPIYKLAYMLLLLYSSNKSLSNISNDFHLSIKSNVGDPPLGPRCGLASKPERRWIKQDSIFIASPAFVSNIHLVLVAPTSVDLSSYTHILCVRNTNLSYSTQLQ